MKLKKVFLLLLATPLFLGSCTKNNGLCFCNEPVDEDHNHICDVCHKPIEGLCLHEDKDGDHFCDKCGEYLPVQEGPCQNGHTDHDLDGVCDVCGAKLDVPEHSHIDSEPQDGKCDICGATMKICTEHVDTNGDGKCDNCGADVSTPTPPPGPKEQITTYLVLSSVGLYEGKQGNKINDMNIENAIAFVAYPGEALPGKDKVTHAYGSADFDGWLCYEGKGAPTVYSVVPEVANMILYASFKDNGNTPTPPPDPTPIPIPGETVSYYLRTNFMSNNQENYWDCDGAKIFVWVWSDSLAGTSYPMSKQSDNLYKVDLPKGSYTNIIFVRCPADAVAFSWSYIWNQTVDFYFVDGKSTAQITSWGPGSNAQCTVEWVA